MVHYMTPRNAQKAPEEAQLASDVSTELAAMQRVVMALGDLRDDRARLRVIRWAVERFFATALAQAATPTGRQPAPAAASAEQVANVGTMTTADTTLEVDDLHDFFVNDTVGADDDCCLEPEPQPQPAVAEEPIESMLKNFVDDFQRIAAACQLA